ncbi:MAG: hypothetical protein D3925_03315 [Candidatus Electrothrix sp. AR5]|nr:hypothetical protein [Candidatus Electrothrix sp. AR5]
MTGRTTPVYCRNRQGEELTKSFANGKNFKKGKLILIGHSMGTILAAEMLRLFPELPFDDIIFMAAACSVKDLTDKIIPYLAYRDNHKINFYNLMLHPQAETRESNLFGIGPVGSLLVWIDQWFEKPDTVLDRTAGRLTNIGLNAHYIGNTLKKAGETSQGDVKSRFHLKVFPYRSKMEEEDVPMEHGSFDDFCFWQENFWKEQDPTIGYGRWAEGSCKGQTIITD